MSKHTYDYTVTLITPYLAEIKIFRGNELAFTDVLGLSNLGFFRLIYCIMVSCNTKVSEVILKLARRKAKRHIKQLKRFEK